MPEIQAISYDHLLTTRGDEDFLGSGSFSSVFRCYHHAHGNVAVKILTTIGGGQARGAEKMFHSEAAVHWKANTFEHILGLIGITQKKPFIGLILEYMPGGNLADLIYNLDRVVPWTFRLRALKEAASGLAFLHNLSEDKRVTHNDIKAENILLTADLHVKLSDFGGSSYANLTGASVEKSQRTSKSNDQLYIHTVSHSAPEFLKCIGGKRTPEMDAYSFAIVIYTVISRHKPFANADPSLISNAVQGGQRPVLGLEETEQELTNANNIAILNIFNLLSHLMKKCWDQVPKERLLMIRVRDSMNNKFSTLDVSKIDEDVMQLKRAMEIREKGPPINPINIWQKYNEINRGQQENPSIVRQPGSRGYPQPQPAAVIPKTTAPIQTTIEVNERPMVKATPFSPAETLHDEEITQNFADPYFRLGASVEIISDIAAVRNAQIGHGGWKEEMKALLGQRGKVKKVEVNGDVVVSLFGVQSHRFNPEALRKIPSKSDLNVGDFVIIELERELVELMQENHGGWIDDMPRYFSQYGLVFRFLPDSDVLVVYKDGRYFRFNYDVLQKSESGEEFPCLSLPANPSIRVGDYVYYDLDDDVMKDLQDDTGWNDGMAELRGRVAKLIYVDYRGCAFVAYSGKKSYVFNPAIIAKLTPEEAHERFKRTRKQASDAAREKASQQIRHYKFALCDPVRVHLPIDLAVELQRGHGGWCHQMLEVYGLIGKIYEFDDNENVQVLFDTGNKWTFNPGLLEKISLNRPVPAPLYTPPFYIGDKVRVSIKELSNISQNEMMYAFRQLDISEEKMEILTKTGTVVGIDDDIDVIVSFGQERNYGFKEYQLKKIN